MKSIKIYWVCLLLWLALPIAAQASVNETVTVDSVVTVNTIVEALNPQGKYSAEFDLKTNLLRDAVGTMSLAAEMKTGRRSSALLGFDWNPWTFSDYTMYKSWTATGEVRWWPRQKGEWTDDRGHGISALNGHFLGLHLLGGEFNYNNVRLPFNAFPSLKDYRYEGWMVGGGISYGYLYNVSRRFALEASVGIGVMHVDYDKYTCDHCGEKVGSGTKLYVGPTQANFSLVVRIGPNPRMKPEFVHLVERRVEITKTIERTIMNTDTIIVAAEPIESTTDTKETIRHADFTLRLAYPLNSSEIVPTLGDNASQLERFNQFLDKYSRNPDIRIESISITGYASIEGNAQANLDLSERRAEAAAELVRESNPRLSSYVEAYGYGEDWESLNFDGKQSLMEISDLDAREGKLRTIDNGALFRELFKTDIPSTRRIECVINFEYVETE